MAIFKAIFRVKKTLSTRDRRRTVLFRVCSTKPHLNPRFSRELVTQRDTLCIYRRGIYSYPGRLKHIATTIVFVDPFSCNVLKAISDVSHGTETTHSLVVELVAKSINLQEKQCTVREDTNAPAGKRFTSNLIGRFIYDGCCSANSNPRLQLCAAGIDGAISAKPLRHRHIVSYTGTSWSRSTLLEKMWASLECVPTSGRYRKPSFGNMTDSKTFFFFSCY